MRYRQVFATILLSAASCSKRTDQLVVCTNPPRQLVPAVDTIRVGDEATLKFPAADSAVVAASQIRWSIESGQGVAVDSLSGVVKGVSPGIATVFALDAQGRSCALAWDATVVVR